MTLDRLQKVLAHAGVASRRKCEELIVAGRVQVDGKTCTELGIQVDPASQTITVDGKPVELESKTCIALHKPTSYVTTVSDPEGRRTVMDLVDKSLGRLYPIGRLDYDTSGLLLLTNDGELANRLMHPSRKIDKTYRVTIIGMPDKAAVKLLREGVPLDDGKTRPAQVEVMRNHPGESVVEITIREGRNRQVRRMFEHIGHDVKRLKRIAYGPLTLGNLAPGKWRLLSASEWRNLYKSAGLTAPDYPGEKKERRKKPLNRNGDSKKRR